MPPQPPHGDRSGEGGAVLVRRTASFEKRAVDQLDVYAALLKPRQDVGGKSESWLKEPFMVGDVERLTLVQDQVIKLRRLAAETFDRDVSVMLYALADELEQRTREADRQQCAPE